MKKKLLGYYDYTVVLTYVGMGCAFYGIMQAVNEHFLNAVVFLMMAGICDMFDGTIASTKNRNRDEKRFGIQIDSLSDLISFGVMPAVFVYMICDKDTIAGMIAGLYVLAALIRLAYFNVTEEERQGMTSEKRTIFQGLPVTTIAVLLPVAYMVQTEMASVRWKSIYLLLLLLCGSGFLMPFEIKKPNVIGKICLVILGILEAAGILFLGWDLI